MNLNKQLEQAIALAGIAHAGQTDKQGMPYILHPLHLMNEMLPDKRAAMVAVLHDVLEDSHYTTNDLNTANFSYDIVVAVNYLTKKPGDSYEVYIRRISSNSLARRVKLADLRHNSDITRLKGVGEKDLQRLKKYHKAYLLLQEAERETQSVYNQ